MAGEWRELRLSEAIELIGGGTPKRKNPSYWNGNIPWLSVKDFNNDFRHVFETEESITSLGLEKSSTKLLDEGQLIISARGTVGELAVLGRPMAFNQSCYGINAKAKIATNSFLFYLLKTSIQGLKKISHGAVFDTITKETFKHINALIPPLPEQKAIAHVLGSLDDKIELNRRMNETLEGMAQALFKSWFVDFDHVIDNALAAGNPIPEPLAQRAETRRQAIANGTANRETAQAFPASFRFTEELGWIPEEWEVKSLSDLINIKGGTQPPSSSFRDTPKEGYIRLVQIRDYDTDTHETYIPETPKLRITSPMDIMIGRYGAAVGRILWGLNGAYNVALVKLDLHRDNIREFIRTYLLSNSFQDQMQAISGRSAQSGFNKGDIKSFNLVVPTELISTLYEDFANPIRVRGLHQNNKSQTLAKLRDVLLPKLISGELRIQQAEKMVEEAIA